MLKSNLSVFYSFMLTQVLGTSTPYILIKYVALRYEIDGC